MDQPSARKVHLNPVPRVGGVAIFLAVIVAAVALGREYNFAQFGSIVVGAAGISFMGLIDDRWGLGFVVKMIGQVLAALLLYATGIYVGLTPYEWLNLLISVFWLGYITNGINFLDNMDGLAGGVSAIAAAYFALMCAFSGQYLVGALSVAVLAACLGFLIYNLNPASIFMGDSGALFLGFVLAAIGIKLRFPDNVQFVTWMVPVLVMGMPIFDTTMVILSRLRRRIPPWTAGKDHVSHRLVAVGMSPREAVLTIYAVCFVLGILAVFVTQASILEGYAVGGAVFLAALYGLWRLERPEFLAHLSTGDRGAASARHA
ncbi:MAG: undecaprenyl/decaprenyl-phosphate alpha-N-acetylglucosaminyl 1-phosphate transferase [Anaerolineae bacterium]|nr:undecaprenyl/decaprenyl-phosphate alpha-N-acetylglucosaminyl 1-phosphate transferase [Anaerolineae bacterium]